MSGNTSSNIVDASILQALFRRKGGEGIGTRIIDAGAEKRYAHLFAALSPKPEVEETMVLICLINAANWLVLTDRRIFLSYEGTYSVVPHRELLQVSADVAGEWREGAHSKGDFTRVILKTIDQQSHIVGIESGAPYCGMLNVLAFIANRNRSIHYRNLI